MSATITDVAKRAGVSPATVSKFLNKKDISEKSRIRIEEAICELDYQVNDFARSLRSNSSRMIGLLVWSIDNVFSTSLFKEVEKRLTELDYSLILCNYNKSADTFVEKIKFLRQRRVGGIVIQLGGQTNELIRQGLRELQESNIPFVLINKCVDGIEANAVLPNDEETIYECVTHLLENGHKKIGMIMSPRNDYKQQVRSDGFRRAFADAGLTADEDLLFGFDDEGRWSAVAKNRMIEFLQAHPELTALVLPGYMLTVTGISALQHVGRKIGEDLALIGFHCEDINQILNPPVTYISLPTDEVASSAIEMLIDVIRLGKDIPPRLILIPAQRIDCKSVFTLNDK